MENRDKTAKLIYRLLWPYRNVDKMAFSDQLNDFYFRDIAEEALDELVYVRYLMLASSQQMEFRWPETSNECFATEPDIYAISGEDGVLLNEPKLLLKGKIITIPSEFLTSGN